jgi:uncharacterized protein (DUF1330 family)|tara:strand:+ start:508 stop:795 length:288 start_codon:yes stop_codon:yes gene_type:complete
MKGYVVCVYKSIRSEVKLKEYAVKAKEAVEKYKGKFLIRGGKATTNEGKKSPRTVVIEFLSYDEANSFYNSKEYQKAHNILKGYAERHHQTIEGA